jgi:hypothetical protein
MEAAQSEGAQQPRQKEDDMKPAIAVATLLLAVSLTACGGEDEPAVCNSSNDLKTSLKDAQKIDIGSGTALADLKSALKEVRSNLATVKEDAESEYSAQVKAIESGYAALRTSIQSATSSTSAATLAAVGAAVSALATDVEALIADVQKTC